MSARHEPSAEPAPAAPSGIGGVVHWIKAKPVQRFGLILALPLFLTLGGVAIWIALRPALMTADEKLQAALERLDAGDFAGARRFAADLRTDSKLSDQDLAGPMF